MIETGWTHKIIFAITAVIFIMTACPPAFAYRLPACEISDQERNMTGEEVLSSYREDYDELSKTVDIGRIAEHKRNPKVRLASREKRAAKKYDTLLAKIKFWEEVILLKGSLVALHKINPPEDAVTEADAIAKDVIETLYTLSQKWRIGSSALFTNFLINTGMKEKGFCYHYVAALRKPLLKQNWRRFEIRWGTAWEDTFRENNALVITAKGRPFEEGVAVDAWRTAGRPFWTKVSGDRFPWVEAFNVEANYEFE